MEENHHVAFESNPIDDQDIAINANNNNNNGSSTTSSDHGWQKVTYAKRQRKTKPSDSNGNNANKVVVSNGSIPGADNVFRSLEKQSEDRRRRILEAQRAAANGAVVTGSTARSKVRSEDEDGNGDDSDEEVAEENGKADVAAKKVVKPKKPKKPKVTVAEAAANIDPNHLAAFLAEISVRFLEFWL